MQNLKVCTVSLYAESVGVYCVPVGRVRVCTVNLCIESEGCTVYLYAESEGVYCVPVCRN